MRGNENALNYGGTNMRKHIVLLLFVATLLAFTSTAKATDIKVGLGKSYTVSSDLIINPGESLIVESAGTLVIEPSVTLTNNGFIDNNGVIKNH